LSPVGIIKLGDNVGGSLFLLALLCPPWAVYLAVGGGRELQLNILLTVLGWVPGVVHAWYILGTHCHALSGACG
jgi:uncharacterized membrane protein YqaE (UPF0057 family)